MIHILIAEDEQPIREGLEDLLQAEGYSTASACDGKAALKAYSEHRFDLLLLDIMMPVLSGYEVCREIRKKDERVPVIFLSAREEEIDKVIGLELGADDYIVKPFGVRELTARIRSVLRRAERPANSGSFATEPFFFGVCSVDPATQTIERDGKQQPLSLRELELLSYFHQHAGTVLSRDHLLSTFWGIEYSGTTRTLDQHIAKLRQKVEKYPSRPRHILTVHGTGYRYQR
jgi:two-component system, OmpR family, alkaline phosphatase synthesis response regulator PhoP